MGLQFFKAVNSNLYLVGFFYYATDLLSDVDSQIPGPLVEWEEKLLAYILQFITPIYGPSSLGRGWAVLVL